MYVKVIRAFNHYVESSSMSKDLMIRVWLKWKFNDGNLAPFVMWWTPLLNYLDVPRQTLYFNLYYIIIYVTSNLLGITNIINIIKSSCPGETLHVINILIKRSIYNYSVCIELYIYTYINFFFWWPTLTFSGWKNLPIRWTSWHLKN